MSISRLEQLRQLVAVHNLTAVALVPGPNMVYFTGLHFHLSERPTVLLVSADPAQIPAIILPALEADNPDAAPVKMQKFTYTDEAGPAVAVQQATQALKLRSAVLVLERR